MGLATTKSFSLETETRVACISLCFLGCLSLFVLFLLKIEALGT